MRPDRLHVAVRPRGILECLDLAVLFCSRRPLGVALAAAVGVAPFVAVNAVLFRGAGAGEGTALAQLLVLTMEAPWATAPLTLFLGQAVFSERFSWRLAGRSLAGGLPALILFQGVLRGICLATVVLSPVVFVGMYHLNPIILLERPALSRVWSRRTAMNMRGIGHVIALVVVQSVVLFGGTILAESFVTAVWRACGGRMSLDGAEAVSVAASLPLRSELAFWALTSFLTVFRFFAYLDARIRREGWDVELKLRAPATYTGLAPRRPEPGRVRAIAMALLVAWCAGSAGPAPAVAGAASSPVGTEAQSAFERQRFPWYDAASGEFRPLLRPRREASSSGGGQQPTAGAAPGGPGHAAPVSDDDFSFESGSGGQPAFGIASAVMIALAVAVVAAAIWMIVRDGLLRPAPADDAAAPEPAVVLGEEQLAALPEPARLGSGDLLARAEALAAEGDYGGAMVLFHGWQLVELHGRGAVELARGKTNGRYAAEVAGAVPGLAPLFRRSNRLFEDAFFGRLPVSRDDFASVWERRREFTAAAAGGG